MPDNNISKKQIWFGIFLVLVMIVGYTLADKFFIGNNKLNEEIKESVDNIEKHITPYEQKNSLKETKIITNFSNSVKSQKISKSEQANVKTEGVVAKGFLYIVASVDNKFLKDDSDVYLKIGASVDGKWIESGGHLIESRSLETPHSDDKTEMLFQLSDVKFKESFNDPDINVTSGNWLSIINQPSVKIFTAFSSTERQGLIHEITIFYECAEATTCSISKEGN